MYIKRKDLTYIMSLTKEKNSNFFAVTIIPILIMTIIIRFISVWYVALSNDIMYMYSVIINILDYTITILSLITKSFGYAAIISAYMIIGGKAGIKTTAFIILIEFLDFASAFIIDIVQKNIVGKEIFAAISVFVNFLITFAVISTISIITSSIAGKRKDRNDIRTVISLSNPPQRAIFFSSVFVLSAKIVLELIYTFQFLYDYNFRLYEGELTAIISSYAKIILTGGVITFIAVTCFYMLINRTIKR